jgi:glutaredoxin-like protein NrdH
MNAVTVYSKPNCQQCRMTYTALDRMGVQYVVVDVTENAAALSYVTDELGYSAAPIVVVDEHNHWSGFRPDLIDALARAISLDEDEGGPQCSCGAPVELGGECTVVTAEDLAAIEHEDLYQSYENGMFITWCICGHGSEGRDPDEADANAMDHCYPEE